MIYLNLQGRIGNQLFMIAFAKKISKERGNEQIVVNDYKVKRRGWVNSLESYSNLSNIKYVHNRISKETLSVIPALIKCRKYKKATKKMNYMEKFEYEQQEQPRFNENGMIVCENGYIEYKLSNTKHVFLDGYFQSEKYFEEISQEIKSELNRDYDIVNYPDLQKIETRNSVCISIKVEHNVGSELYDVCSKEYWEQAIQYILNNVENPLFFICSDDVEYVKNNLIDCSKYDVICQNPTYPVDISLAVMSKCKHFVIGNTTYGWWAQYLCDYSDKIVIAPSRWMAIDMPIDIYQEGWHLIEV